MNLYFERKGTGNPILFLHGFMENSSMWDEILPAFENSECILIDLFGHGKSEFQSEIPEDLSIIAQSIRKLISSFEIQKCTVIGHSLGGYVALELFKIAPELIEKIVLFHAHPWEDSAEKKTDRERVAEFVKTKKDFFITEAIPALFHPTNRVNGNISTHIKMAKELSWQAIAWSARAMKNRKDYVSLFVSNPSKFFVIQGEFDLLIPKERMHEFCTKLHVDYQEIKSVAHMSHAEDPKKVMELFKKITSSVELIE